MSKFIRCDGCGRELRERPAGNARTQQVVIHGERANKMGGGAPLPDGEFDWCEGCANTAFTAVRNVNAGRNRP